MAIRTNNLNLIPILQALLRESSVAKAADHVGLSQPAMSGALARLRLLLDDPILVRVGRNMRLTPRAERMRRNLDDICAQIELLFQADSFDPATSNCSFVIAAPDYLSYQISQKLLPHLAESAPGVRVIFCEVPMDLNRDADDGTVDLAVCADLGFWPEMKREFLFSDRIIAAVSKSHPLAGSQSVTTEELFSYPSISYFYDTKHLLLRQPELAPTGLASLDQPTSIITDSQFGSVLAALQLPNVARCNASLAQRLLQHLPLSLIEISDESTEMTTSMLWSEITDKSLEHIWLRSVVRYCLDC